MSVDALDEFLPNDSAPLSTALIHFIHRRLQNDSLSLSLIEIISKMNVISLMVLLLGSVTVAEPLEDTAGAHPSSHQHRELQSTIFCRCVADFETFYDRRRQLKSYFLYGDLPAPTGKTLREKTSKYYNQDFTGVSPRQGSSGAVEGPDGFVIVDGITVLPLDDEACIVSQTNSALRSFLEIMFRPRNRSRSKGVTSLSGLFQNRRSLLSVELDERAEEHDENEHDVDERELQGWGDRRNNKPTKPGRGGNSMSLRDKNVKNVLNNEDLREYVPDSLEGSQPRPQPSPSGFPRVFPCPPAVVETDAPTAAPSDAIESIVPSTSPSMTVQPGTDKPTVSLQPTISIQPTTTAFPTVSPEPTISPVPSVAPSTGLEASDMPSVSPSVAPSMTFPPSLPPSVSPAPTVSSQPTNVNTAEPTDSRAPTTSPMPSIPPTTSLSPSSDTQEPSNSNPPSVLPSVLPSVDPTISVFPTISPAPTISRAPNAGVTPTLSPNIEPTFSQAPSVSEMPSRVPSFSDRPTDVPTFPPSFNPTVTALPTTPPQTNITDSMARFRPKNNLCDAAVSLPMDGSPMSGTTVLGTNEVDYGCNDAGGIQTSISPGVWFTAVGNGNIYEVSTCSDRTNFGTAIQVLTGGCEDLQCLRNAGRIFDRACSNSETDEWNRFGTRVRVETIPDEVYSFLVLSRLGENTGVFDIHLEEIVTPPNDHCDGAILMEVDIPRLHIGNTVSASIGTNYGCGSLSLGVNNVAPGIWYKVVGNGRTYSASTCTEWTTFDTAIQVFTGSSCNELECVAGSSSGSCSVASGSSTVSFPTIAGETYFIYVFGRQQSDVGTFILTIKSSDPTV